MNWLKIALKNELDNSSPENQKGTVGIVFDIQRYGFDNYFIRTAYSKSDDNISVSLVITHGDLGSTAYSNYWFYELNESKIAEKTYKEVNKVVKDVMSKFTAERIPTALLFTYIRSGIEDIDKEHTASYNIPWMNFSKDVKIDPDWRSNIYGTRYPKYTEQGKKKEIQIRKNVHY